MRTIEIAVAYYPFIKDQSYVAIYNYSIETIYNGSRNLISQITTDDVEYINTYGEDIHISNNKIVGIGHDTSICNNADHDHD